MIQRAQLLINQRSNLRLLHTPETRTSYQIGRENGSEYRALSDRLETQLNTPIPRPCPRGAGLVRSAGNTAEHLMKASA